MTVLTIPIENPVSRLCTTYKTVGNKHDIEVKELTREICMKYPFELLGEYTKLFYDLDWGKEIKDKKGNVLLPKYVEDKALVKQLVDHLETIQSHYTNGFVFTNGSTPEKLSFHIIFKKQFIKREKNIIPREDLVQWLLGDLYKSHRDIVDTQVYDPNRKMRLPYGVGDGKTNPHIPNRFSVNDLNEFLINPIVPEIKVRQEEPKEEKKEVKEDKEEKEVEEPETDFSRKENMMKYLEMIKKERFCNRPAWLELGGLMRANKLSVKDFLRFSRESGYADYNEEDCYKLWYSLNEDKGCGFPKLQQWAEEDGINWREIFSKRQNSIVNQLLRGFKEYGKLTNRTVAEVFFHFYKKNLYYVGKEWIHYTEEKGWEFGDDDSVVYPLMKTIGDAFKSHVKGIKIPADLEEEELKKKRKEKLKMMEQSSKLADYTFCVKVIKTSRSLFRNDKIIQEFDCYPNWFCFKNQKAIDISTGEVIEIKQIHKILTTCGYNLPERKEEHIQRAEDFIKTFQPEHYDSYMSCLATSIRGGNLNQVVFIHTGNGSNGKSLIGKLLTIILGDYSMTFPIEQITQNASSKSQANSDLAQSRGKRYAQSNEPPSSNEKNDKDSQITLKTDKIKELTGDDRIRTRELYKGSTEFEIQFTLNILCNDPPKLSKNDGGIERRVKLIPYLYKFVDKEVLDEETKKYDESRKELSEELEKIQEKIRIIQEETNEKTPNLTRLQEKEEQIHKELTNPFRFKLRDDELGTKLKQDKDLQDGMLYLLMNHWRKNNGKYIQNEVAKERSNEYMNDNNPLVEWLKGYNKTDKKDKKNYILVGQLLKTYNAIWDSKLKSGKFTDFLEQAKIDVIRDDSNGHKIFIEKKPVVEEDE
jgi:phage/plasmid-associated DNA primase